MVALLVQLTGDSAPAPCEKCAVGCGQFASCVVVSSKTDPGNMYGCANLDTMENRVSAASRPRGETDLANIERVLPTRNP